MADPLPGAPLRGPVGVVLVLLAVAVAVATVADVFLPGDLPVGVWALGVVVLLVGAFALWLERVRPAAALAVRPILTADPTLRRSLADFLATVDETGNTEALVRVRQVRQAVQQDPPDVECLLEMRRWFVGRPGGVGQAGRAFFAAPTVRALLAAGLATETTPADA